MLINYNEKKGLFLLTVIFFIIGFLFVYSSSINPIKTDNFFIKKQVFGLFLSFFLIFFISTLNSNFIKNNSSFFYFLSLILCFITRLKPFGITLNGASRWIKIFSLSFQPVEILKPFYILYLAYLIDKNKYQNIKNLKLISFILLITSFILILQPDFGHVFILTAITLIIFFSINPKKKFIIYTFLISLIAISIVAISKPYRIKRLLIFLDPWKDPKGKGFQIIQSLIAIKNGGFFGVGIGKSIQKLSYLPMQNTDFIFSIICEEGGILMGFIIIFLFYIFTNIGLNLSKKISEKSTFYGLSILGLVCVISLQAFMNILVSTGAIPTKGIGLPFISYGVSSLIGTGLTIGLILNFSKKSI